MASLGFAVVTYLVVCTVWFRRTTESGGDSVWSAIPGWQYTGQHAESGGTARKEQEDALRELQDVDE